MRMNLKLDLNYKKKKEEERENKMLKITIFNRDKDHEKDHYYDSEHNAQCYTDIRADYLGAIQAKVHNCKRQDADRRVLKNPVHHFEHSVPTGL